MWWRRDCSARYIPFVCVLHLNCVELQTEEIKQAEARCQSLPVFSWVPQQAPNCSISVLLPSPARGVASRGQNELQNTRAMKSWQLYQLHKVTSAMQSKKRGKRVPSGIPVFLAVVIESLFGKCIIIYKTPVFSCLTSSQLFWFPICFFCSVVCI